MENLKHMFKGKNAMSLIVTVVIAVSAVSIAYLSYQIRQSINPSNPDSPLAVDPVQGPGCKYNFQLVQTPVTPPPPTPTTCNAEMEIALVIDRSSTMNQLESDGRRKVEWAKDAARGFVQALAATRTTSVKVSVVSFGGQGNDGTGILDPIRNSTLHIGATNDYNAVINAINNVRFIDSFTCIQCGIRIGNNQVLTGRDNKVVVLLSDGMANHNWNGTTSNSKQNAISEANSGRTRGITYRVIGYGQSGQIDETTLKSIAGNTSYYQYKPNISQWSSAFLTVLTEICRTTPRPNPSTPTPAPAALSKDSVGVFRPSNGAIYLKNSNTTGFADLQINYGIAGDKPVVGDWDGNGTTTVGVFRNGTFYLRNSNTIGFADITFAYGLGTDQPIAGDWNGDGRDTVGIFRPSNATFYLKDSNAAGNPNYQFSLGVNGDVAIAGDWNGDGRDTVGIFRPSNGAIYLKNTNATGFADVQFNYGVAGDKPVTGDWNNDGRDTVGVFRGNYFYLRNSNSAGSADVTFNLGVAGDLPIAGDWDNRP